MPKVAKRCPKGSQKWSKNDQKSILGTLSSICYLLYELHIGRSWGGSQRDKNTVAFSEPSQEGSRGAPMAQRWSKGWKMGVQRVSKMEQKASKRGPKNTPSFLLHPLGAHGGPRDPFRWIWVRFLVDFRSIFRGFWSTFSIFLGHFSCCVAGCFAGLLYLFVCFFLYAITPCDTFRSPMSLQVWVYIYI